MMRAEMTCAVKNRQIRGGRDLADVDSCLAAQIQKEWQKQLTPLQYDVTRRAATEFAFSGPLYESAHATAYTVASIAARAFQLGAKFDSGTGWPSFWLPSRRKTSTRAVDMKRRSAAP